MQVAFVLSQTLVFRLQMRPGSISSYGTPFWKGYAVSHSFVSGAQMQLYRRTDSYEVNRRAFCHLEWLPKNLRTDAMSERGSVAKSSASRRYCALRGPLVWNMKLQFRRPSILVHLTARFYNVYLD